MRRSGSLSGHSGFPWIRFAGVVVALLAAAPLISSVLAPGWFVGHDDLHAIRLFEHDLVLRSGQIPVRWYPDLAGGYGAPHPVFYAPLFYILAQGPLLAGAPLTVAIKLAMAAILGATSLAMYRFSREFLGVCGGVVAAAAYTFAPYHLLDLYVRTAFSEVLTFLFIPWLLHALVGLSRRPSPRNAGWAALATGGLLLSHTITAMFVPLIAASYGLFLIWCERRDRGAPWRLAGSVVLGFGLAAFFLLPAAAEIRWIDTSVFDTEYFKYASHFVLPSQLLFSPWGFGLSGPGAADGLSFRLGLLHLAGGIAGLWALSRRGLWQGTSRSHAAFVALAGLAGLTMALPVSGLIWSIVRPLAFVQFPWRFLIWPAFALSFLSGAAMKLVRLAPARRFAIACLVAAGFAGASVGMIGFEKRLPLSRLRFRAPSEAQRREDRALIEAGEWRLTRRIVREQTLDWNDHLPPEAYPYPPPSDLDRPRAEIASGSASVELLDEGPVGYRMRIVARSPALLRLNVYRFPGWVWSLDGAPRPWGRPPEDRPALTLDVPAGEHVAEARMIRTPDRWAGDLLSLASLAVALVLLSIRRPGDPAGSAADD